MTKIILHIALAFIIPLMGNGQVFFNGNAGTGDKNYNEFVLIPSIHSGYSLKHHEFLAINNGLEIKREIMLPELYFGCQLVSDGFLVGVHYGVIQQTIMLGAGVALLMKVKKKKSKGNF